MFIDRTSEKIKLDIFGKVHEYKYLQKIEFNSDRKKMTIIIEDPET